LYAGYGHPSTCYTGCISDREFGHGRGRTGGMETRPTSDDTPWEEGVNTGVWEAHFERQVSHYVRQRPEGNPRAAWGRGRVARPLKGQRCSCGRQPSLAPPTRRLGAGQVMSPPPPGQRMTMKEQILCHCAGTDRENSALEATPASYRHAADGVGKSYTPLPG